MTDFSVTWDYRCPFARNAHDHVVTALEGGAAWDVTFLPFSLGQVHVADGESPVWERPQDDSGLLALQAGTYVRDTAPEQFLGVHRALFDARHDQGLDLRDRDVVAKVLIDHDVDAEATLAAIDDGTALASVRAAHEAAAADHAVWGVPTFIVGDQAAFVRLMDRPEGDADRARTTIQQVIDLFTQVPTLNEFKHTTVGR